MPQDLDRARRYFRLCAAGRNAACQVRLARLLLQGAERQERELVQAIAWLQLAAESGLADAKTLLGRESPALTPDQSAWAASLKRQLVSAPE